MLIITKHQRVYQLTLSQNKRIINISQSPKVFSLSLSRRYGLDGKDGKSGADLIIGETPTGLLDGQNAIFMAKQNFVPESLEVFLNGLRLTNSLDYHQSGLAISLFESPKPTEIIIINYKKI
jgi:hypothetical protein